MRILLSTVLFILIISLCSCAPRRPAKVDEIGAKKPRIQNTSKSRPNKNNHKTHRVIKGDSLYSIGFRYQKDYKTLAAINNIAPPYRIYPDQIIKLTGPVNKIVFKPNDSPNNSTVVDNGVVQTKPIVTNQPITAQTEPTINIKTIPTVKNQTSTGSPTSKPQVTTKPITSTTTKPATNQPTVSTKPTAKKPLPVSTPKKTDFKWLWPTNGKIRSTFLASNPARKGISIGGKEGQDVKAAEDGVVVYSGNGLLGYGELIIIKHNDAFLSAYGHNKSLKVTEGQSVTRGQTIAELGSTGTNVNNLHFEIRKNGKPVNPLNYVKP